MGPSLLACAAVLMSNEYLGRQDVWPSAMVHQGRHSESSLRCCAAELRTLLDKPRDTRLQAVQRKYRLRANHAVADLAPRRRSVLVSDAQRRSMRRLHCHPICFGATVQCTGNVWVLIG